MSDDVFWSRHLTLGRAIDCAWDVFGRCEQVRPLVLFIGLSGGVCSSSEACLQHDFEGWAWMKGGELTGVESPTWVVDVVRLPFGGVDGGGVGGIY